MLTGDNKVTAQEIARTVGIEMSGQTFCRRKRPRLSAHCKKGRSSPWRVMELTMLPRWLKLMLGSRWERH